MKLTDEKTRIILSGLRVATRPCMIRDPFSRANADPDGLSPAHDTRSVGQSHFLSIPTAGGIRSLSTA